jgi:DNA-directed RNA polymerase specialized sigma24 family protein
MNMNHSSSEEKKLVEQLLNEKSGVETTKQINKLLTVYDAHYRDEIQRIIKSKYVLSTDDKSEAAKDLYSQAMEIFLMKLNENTELLRGLNYRAFMLGIARNLFLERTRKDKEIPVDASPVFEAVHEELHDPGPFESENVQKKIEEALVTYYMENDLRDCLKILYYGWKEDFKNAEIAGKLGLENHRSAEAARQVTVLQQNCMKKAWRNIPLLQQVKEAYNIKKRNKHNWFKSKNE